MNYLGNIQVGAVLVKEGKVVGKGWNRMPTGCEGEFAWGRDRGVEPLENGKQLYGDIIHDFMLLYLKLNYGTIFSGLWNKSGNI